MVICLERGADLHMAQLMPLLLTVSYFSKIHTGKRAVKRVCVCLCVPVAGVLGYYLAQLNDMIQYTDLRTEVFQSFREIGNAVLFCLLVEQSLVCVTHFTGVLTYTFSVVVITVTQYQEANGGSFTVFVCRTLCEVIVC